MKKIYTIAFLAVIISAGFYLAVFWYSHSGAASTLNPSYKGNVTDGLVGWWTFDGSATTTVADDKSGYGNNGTRYGGTTLVAGKLGQGMGFDGASSTVSVADSNSLDVTNFTLSAWAKRDELSRMDSIISKGSYSLKIGPDAIPFAEIITGSSTTSTAVGTPGRGTGLTASSTNAFANYKGKLYAGFDSGYIKRYDGGTTWTDVGSIGTGKSIYSMAVYNGALYSASFDDGHVYRYDGGTTWTGVGETVNNGNYYMAVYNGKLYSAGPSAVYRYDGGTTWTSVGAGSGAAVFSLIVHNGNLYSGGSDSSSAVVWRYDGGTTWTSVLTGLTSTAYSLGVYKGDLYAGLYGGSIYRYSGKGTTWTSVGNPSGTRIDSFAEYNGGLYMLSSGTYFYQGGTSWTTVGTAFGESAYRMRSFGGKLFIGALFDATVVTIGNGEAVYGSTVLNTGFNHLAGSYDGTTMKLWVNGSLDTTLTTSTTVATNTLPLLIGSSYGASGREIGEENFDGTLDDARVYNRALSSAEIQKTYQMGAGSTVSKTLDSYGFASRKSDLVGWWTFDGSTTGTVANDKSGAGNNGTVDVSVPMAGKLGQGLYFNLSSSTVTVADSNSLDVTNFTLSAWAKANDWSMNSVISKGSYALKIGPDKIPFAEIITNSTATSSFGQILENYSLTSLTVYKGTLYAGVCWFTCYVYKYDQGAWVSLGTPEANNVNIELGVYNGDLYAGITSAGIFGTAAYKYGGGTTWTSAGGIDGDATWIRGDGFIEFKGKLYFKTMHNSGYSHLNRYDGGTTWKDTGLSVYDGSPPVVWNGRLYMGGGDTSVSAYIFDGSTTAGPYAIVGGSGPSVDAMVVYDDHIYASLGNGTSSVQRNDSATTWKSTYVGTGVASTMRVYDDKLYGSSSDGSGYLNRYDGGTTWTPFYIGSWGSPQVVYDGKLFGSLTGSSLYTFGDGAAVYSTSSIQSAGFNHLASTYDGTSLKLFLSGSLTASSSTSRTVATTTSDLLIGSSHGSSRGYTGEENFCGVIDDARVYNRALSDDEIYALAKSGVNTVNKTPGTTAPLSSSGINSGLLGWWTFDGSATTTVANDRSASGNHGTFDSAHLKPFAGRVGQGVWSDGTAVGTAGSWVTLSASTTVPAIASIGLWFRITTTSTGDNYVFRVAPSSGATMELAVYTASTTGRVYVYQNDATPTSINTNTRSLYDKWHHLVWTSDGSVGSLYLDGSLNWSGAQSRAAKTNNAILGKFDGKIDDVRLYNRILSASEVTQLYRMGK